MGLYDRPSDIIAIRSIKVPDGSVSRALRDATKWVTHLQELAPDLDHLFDILVPG